MEEIEKNIISFLRSGSNQKRILRELMLYTALRLGNPRENQDIIVTKSVTTDLDGNRKTLYTLGFTEGTS